MGFEFSYVFGIRDKKSNELLGISSQMAPGYDQKFAKNEKTISSEIFK